MAKTPTWNSIFASPQQFLQALPFNIQNCSSKLCRTTAAGYPTIIHQQPTYGGDSGDNLSKLELVEDGRLSRSIEPHHQDPHFLLPEEALNKTHIITDQELSLA